MAQTTINNGDSGLTARNAINNNFTELYNKTPYVTVGTGGDYATVYLALAAGKRNLKIISNIVETTTWTTHIHSNLKTVLWAEQMYTVTLSAATGSYTGYAYMSAYNLEFKITGTNDIFYRYNVFSFYNCKITGDTNNNIFCSNYSTIDADILTVNCGSTGTLTINYLRNIGHLKITGAGAAGTGLSSMHGVINIIENDTVTNRSFVLNYTTVMSVTGTQMNFYLYNNATIFNTIGTKVYITPYSSWWKVYGCYIETLFISGTGRKGIVQNCEIDNIVYDSLRGEIQNFVNNKVNEPNAITLDSSTASSYVIQNCIFAKGLIVNADNITIKNCQILSGTITIAATADKTIVDGCRTQSAIVDGGTNTVLSNNLLI